jgi:hypothetical protein
VFAVPHTATEDAIEVLLVKRHLVQARVDGQLHRGVVPNWAGQWGLIAARPLVSQSMETTVQGAVLAQTGIDLSDPASAERYRIVGAEPQTLKDGDDKPVSVLFLTFLPEGLHAFAADAEESLATGKVRDGVIDTLEIKPLASALSLVAPCHPPPAGWAGLLRATQGSGRTGRPLRSPSPDLLDQLATRAAMAPTGARLAIARLAACNPSAAPPPEDVPSDEARLVELRVIGACRGENGGWYQTYAPGQAIYIQALTQPPSAAAVVPIAWQGGEPDALGRPDWRTLPLGRLSRRGTSFPVKALLGADVHERRIAVVPHLTGVEVSRAHGIYPADAAPNAALSGAVWVRAVVSPATEEAFRYLKWYGGAIDPAHPLDRRLVSVQDVVADGKGLGVEIDLAADVTGEY